MAEHLENLVFNLLNLITSKFEELSIREIK